MIFLIQELLRSRQ